MRLSHSKVKVADNCSALIDTGVEVCLKGLVAPELFEPARRGLHLMGANGQRLEGGSKEVLLGLNISGTLQETGRQVDLKIPTYFYEADIKDDVILSYNWCRLRGVDISARHHGLLCVKSRQEIWIDWKRAQEISQPETLVRIVECVPQKRFLDLFFRNRQCPSSSAGSGV